MKKSSMKIKKNLLLNVMVSVKLMIHQFTLGKSDQGCKQCKTINKPCIVYMFEL
jgi:hypothetical protein